MLKRIVLAPACALAVAAALLVPGAASAQSYSIRPGDVLSIEVIEDPTINRQVLVGPDGRVTVPLAGSLQAGGRSVEEVTQELTGLLAPNFASTPSVFVGLARVASADPLLAPTEPPPPPTIDVFVVGAAASPGRLSLDPGTTVLQLFAQMGGFSAFAATKRIQLRRTDPGTGQETIYALDYEAIERGTSRAGAAELADGDIIVVPQRRLFE